MGDYVCVHSQKLGNKHIVCRIVTDCDGRFQLYCSTGVLNRSVCGTEPVQSAEPIVLHKWRQAPGVPFSDVVASGLTIECSCTLPESSENVHVISSSEDEEQGSEMCVANPVYSLSVCARELIMSTDGWLMDEIITAAQSLILQHFPLMKGLQPPPLQKVYTVGDKFGVHRGEFVQIIHVRNNHWCVVSTVGCERGVINVYDSLYGSMDSETEYFIASMVFYPVRKLTIQMMNVERQNNLSDCGVLAIAYAFDICSGCDPCKAKFDSSQIRQHLVTCLSNCKFSRFPVIGGERRSHTAKPSVVDLYCKCHLPEREGDKMVQCDRCQNWFHQYCQDVPKEVFEKE